MSRAEHLKWSGWAFILAALALITILTSSDAVAIPGSAISSLLLVAGLAGLRDLYGKQLAGFGRNSMQIALIAAALFLCLPLGVMAVTGDAGWMQKGLWVLLFGGPAVMLLGLTLFGLAALRSKPMRRLNWMPAVASIWYPLGYILFAVHLLTHRGISPPQYFTALQVICLIQFLALCALGAVLITDATQENINRLAES